MKFQHWHSRITIIWAIAAALFTPLATQAGDFGIGARAGLQGLGGELSYRAGNHFGLRLQAQGFNYDDDIEESGIEYVGAIQLSTAGIVLDWHPFGGSFRISAGTYLNNNKLRGTSNGAGDYDIGDETFTSLSADPIVLNLSVDLGKSTAPYIGLGWGHSPKRERGLMFSLDMGAMFSGLPRVDLSGSGTAIHQGSGFVVDMATNPFVQAEIAKEAASLEDDISGFEIFPVIMLGIGYRF